MGGMTRDVGCHYNIPYKCYILWEFSLAFAQLYPIGGHYYRRSI